MLNEFLLINVSRYLRARQTLSREFDVIVLYAVCELFTAVAVRIFFIFITAGF